MKTTEKLVKATRALLEANIRLMELEIALEKKTHKEKLTDAFGLMRNAEQRETFLRNTCDAEMAKVEEAKLEKMKAASERDIAEIEWKSEKYDILAKTGGLPL